MKIKIFSFQNSSVVSIEDNIPSPSCDLCAVSGSPYFSGSAFSRSSSAVAELGGFVHISHSYTLPSLFLLQISPATFSVKSSLAM
jgi:hypothetical protein